MIRLKGTMITNDLRAGEEVRHVWY